MKNNQNQSRHSNGWGGKRGRAGRKPGVPNKVTADVRAAAQEYSADALKTLAVIMQKGKPDTARVAASKEILDRAFGRSLQAMQLSGHDGGPIVLSQERQDIEDIELARRLAWCLTKGEEALNRQNQQKSRRKDD